MKHRTPIAIPAIALTIGLMSASCSRPLPGTIQERLTITGMPRSCLVHLPPTFDGETKLPLLIALHPFTGSGQFMEKMTGFSALANCEGFIAAYPDGYQRVWNADPAAPSSILGSPADDVAFLSALIDYLIDKYHADPGRVYVTGASSGGLMAHRIACELTGKLAAVASVMITLPLGWQDYLQPSGPLPFLIIQGVADPFFPWDGGTVNQGPFRQSQYLSAEATAAFWVNFNNAISPPTETNLPDIDPTDGTSVFRRDYASNPGGAEVVFYGINGGGHTWPGSADAGLAFLVGATSRDISATQLIWDFLKTHSRGT